MSRRSGDDSSGRETIGPPSTPNGPYRMLALRDAPVLITGAASGIGAALSSVVRRIRDGLRSGGFLKVKA